MRKSNKKKRPKSPPGTGTSGPEQPSPRADRIARENGRIVGLGIVGVALSVAIAFPPLSVLLSTAPIVRPLLRRTRAGDAGAVTGAFWRWALTVYLTILVSAAFTHERMLAAYPFASGSAEAVERALSGDGALPAGVLYLVVGLVVFIAFAAGSLGIAACVLMTVALGMTAAAAAVVFAHGHNGLVVALVAVPPWLWAVVLAAVFALAPAALTGGAKWYGVGNADLEPEWLKRRAIIVAGLLVLAVVLRLTLAGPYVVLLRHCTIF